MDRNRIKYRRNITYVKLFLQWFGWERTNSWQSAEYSLNFKANDDNLNFDNTDNLANANDNYSGGLLFVGLCLNENKGPCVGSLFKEKLLTA